MVVKFFSRDKYTEARYGKSRLTRLRALHTPAAAELGDHRGWTSGVPARDRSTNYRDAVIESRFAFIFRFCAFFFFAHPRKRHHARLWGLMGLDTRPSTLFSFAVKHDNVCSRRSVTCPLY